MRIEPFELERYFSEYEFAVPYLLCSSDSESMTVRELLEMEPGSLDALQKLWLGYTEYSGHPQLRADIASLYTDLPADCIMVHSGAQEAITNFMMTMLEPRDHVVVHYPAYQSLYSVAEAIGCEVTRWKAHHRHGWRLDLDDLELLVRPNTRVVVVNCPHNPTGSTMSAADFGRLIALSRRHGFTILSDEVYRFSEYNVEDRLPAACELDERAVSIGVMSKSFGLAGLRIGWIATRHQAVLSRMAAQKDYTTICNSAPSELLAGIALRHRDRILHRNLGIIMRNLQTARAFFERHAGRLEWVPPRAGPIAFPRVLQGAADPLCRRLVEECGVLLLPGSKYDEDYAAHFRLGLGRANFPQALEKLDSFLKTFS